MRDFDPLDWYWIVGGDEAQAWSSAAGIYVASDDETYAAWLASGGAATRIASEAELSVVLHQAGLAVPDPLTIPLNRFQFDAMLRILGLTDAAIEAAIDTAVTDPTENAIAKARFYRAETYNRSHPLFALLAPQVGLTGAQIDAAWATAVAIR